MPFSSFHFLTYLKNWSGIPRGTSPRSGGKGKWRGEKNERGIGKRGENKLCVDSCKPQQIQQLTVSEDQRVPTPRKHKELGEHDTKLTVTVASLVNGCIPVIGVTVR